MQPPGHTPRPMIHRWSKIPWNCRLQTEYTRATKFARAKCARAHAKFIDTIFAFGWEYLFPMLKKSKIVTESDETKLQINYMQRCIVYQHQFDPRWPQAIESLRCQRASYNTVPCTDWQQLISPGECHVTDHYWSSAARAPARWAWPARGEVWRWVGYVATRAGGQGHLASPPAATSPSVRSEVCADVLVASDLSYTSYI